MFWDFNKLNDRINALLIRIDNLSWNDYKSTREELRDISDILKSSNLSHIQRQSLWGKNSSGFTALDEFKEKHFTNVEQNYNLKKNEILDWMENLRQGSVRERDKAYKITKGFTQEIYHSDFAGNKKKELKKIISSCFDLLKDKKIQELFFEYDREVYFNSFKNLLTKNISEFNFPTSEPEQTPKFKPPVKSYTVNLNKFLDSYPDVFNFKDSSKKIEFRSEQIQYSIMCYEGVSIGKDVVIEGPTGLGKTRALIASVLPFLREDKKNRLIYTTRTATQVNSVVEDLRTILPDIEGIDATIFLGTKRIKEEITKCYDENLKIIEESEIEFEEKDCKTCLKKDSRNNNPSNLEKLAVLGYSELKKASSNNQCPLPLYMKKAKTSRIIVMPHSYLYDSHWITKYVPDKENAVLIVDEGHNFLTDAGSSPYLKLGMNAPISKDDKIFAESRQSNTFYINDMLIRLSNVFADTRKTFKISGIEIKDIFPHLFTIYNELKNASDELEKDVLTSFTNGDNKESNQYLLKEGGMFDFTSKLSGKFYENICNLNGLISQAKGKMKRGDDYFNRIVQPSVYSFVQILDSIQEIIQNPYSFVMIDDANTLSFQNLHPKFLSERATKGFHSRIFTSATLSPPSDVGFMLDLNEPLMAKIDPVFDDKNYEVFLIGGINSSYKEELRESDACFTGKEYKVLEDMFDSAISAASTKNIGIFCNSNHVVQDIHKLLSKTKAKYNAKLLTFISDSMDGKDLTIEDDYKNICDIFSYDPEMRSNHSAENVIQAFMDMENQDITTLLVGVAGGKLAEGIDYFGDKMEMVITIGLPYPSSAAEQKINKVKQNYFFMLKGDKSLGEDLAYKQDAFRKLAQSIGRAHRGKKEKAVVICADERLIGIKNVKGDSLDRYEYLNLFNVQKNMKLLQRPISQINKNIVFGGYDMAEEDDLKKYISNGLSSPDDFINFQQMAEKIKKFYRK